MTIKKHVKAGGGVDLQMEGPVATLAIVLHVERKSRSLVNSFDRDAKSKLDEE